MANAAWKSEERMPWPERTAQQPEPCSGGLASSLDPRRVFTVTPRRSDREKLNDEVRQVRWGSRRRRDAWSLAASV